MLPIGWNWSFVIPPNPSYGWRDWCACAIRFSGRTREQYMDDGIGYATVHHCDEAVAHGKTKEESVRAVIRNIMTDDFHSRYIYFPELELSQRRFKKTRAK